MSKTSCDKMLLLFLAQAALYNVHNSHSTALSDRYIGSTVCTVQLDLGYHIADVTFDYIEPLSGCYRERLT